MYFPKWQHRRREEGRSRGAEPEYQGHGDDPSRHSRRKISEILFSDEINVMENDEEAGNVGSEHERVNNKLETKSEL